MQFVNAEEIRLSSSELAQPNRGSAVATGSRERDSVPGGCTYVFEALCRLDPVVNVAS
jgi:hypothetical protein